MVHLHEVRDTDKHFVIDPITRAISTTSEKNKLMQGDHNSEIYTFEIPRLVEGHDMTLCNRIRIHYNDISADKANESRDFYPVKDMQVAEDLTDMLVFSWPVSGNATKYAGLLSFRIQFLCIENGETTYAWHTDIYKGITISDGFDNSEAAVEEYSDVIEKWEAELFGAGDSVMANIESKGSEQIAAIEDAGSAATSAVEAKGAETLATIPDDYTELYGMANDAVRTRANAIVENVEGNLITANDCSGDYLRGLRVFGKSEQLKTTGAQLANFKDVATLSNNGLTWSCKNGVVKVSGTTTALSSTSGLIGCEMTGKVGAFHISGSVEEAEVYVAVTKADGSTMWHTQSSFELDGTETKVLVYCQVYSAGVTVNTTLYPMVCAGDTALPWEPYTGGVASPSPEWAQEISSVENPGISIFGKNLAYFGHILPKTSNGVTFSLQEDGSVIAHGTPTVSGEEVIDTIHAQSITRPTLVNGQIYESDSTIQIEHNDGSMTYNRIVTITDDIKSINSYIQPRAEYYTNGQVFRMKLWLVGNEMQEFEAAKPVQTVTIPHTLPGIPVSSGGNYTDANGQQWICDEVDLARGVYVQRVKRLVLNGSEIWRKSDSYLYIDLDEHAIKGGKGFCSHFVFWYNYGGDCIFASEKWVYVGSTTSANYDVDTWKEFLSENNVTLLYILATPIETALTDEELFNFSQLHSNYPNTTVLNDAGAWMEVAYNADTQLYFNNSRGATDEQVEKSVDAWLTAHYSNAEGVAF